MHSSAQALTAAREANITHRARDVVSLSPQIELHYEPDLPWISCEILHPHLIRVFRGRLPTEEVNYTVAAIMASLNRAACP